MKMHLQGRSQGVGQFSGMPLTPPGWEGRKWPENDEKIQKFGNL